MYNLFGSFPKGNGAYIAINRAQEEVRQTGSLPVPTGLRNAPTKLMKELGYGDEYLYSHDYPGNFVKQNFFPEGLKNSSFFKAGSGTKEQEIAAIIKKLWDK